MAFEEDFVSLTPVNFFQFTAECKRLPVSEKASFPLLTRQNYPKYLLPDMSAYCSEESFAKIAMGWNEEGIECCVVIGVPFKRAFYPEVTKGDSIELFFDTRDVKTSGFNTRFCHHFFFFAEALEGRQAGELTHFRSEDAHPLCDSAALKVKSETTAAKQTINLFIPAHCLHGYEPEQFTGLGFSYRINRTAGYPQHFSVVSEDYQIDEQPSLWSSLRLVQ